MSMKIKHKAGSGEFLAWESVEIYSVEECFGTTLKV
jgi:hypothetical protein